MSNFIKYSSIENHYREKFLNMIEMQGLQAGTWYATEKVHGANFSVILTPEGDTLYASRNGVLGEDEAFYNHKDVINRIIEDLHDVQTNLFIGKTVQFFGEIFGGSYLGTTSQGSKRCQKGVQYSCNNNFLIFDIVVDGLYLPFSGVIEVCKEYFLPIVPVLHKGTYEECLEHSNKFVTKVPNLYKLQEIDDNFCEGLVIKPDVTSYVGDRRVIIKSKNKEFSEVQRIPRQKVAMPDSVKEFLTDVEDYATKARVANVASKMGELEMSDFGKLMGETVGDTIDEFILDYPDLGKLERPDKKLFSKEVQKMVVPLVREYMGENV